MANLCKAATHRKHQRDGWYKNVGLSGYQIQRSNAVKHEWVVFFDRIHSEKITDQSMHRQSLKLT